jgi:hypothetical protein
MPTVRTNHSLFSRSETPNGIIGHRNGDPGSGNAGVLGEHLNNGTAVTCKSQGGFGWQASAKATRMASRRRGESRPLLSRPLAAFSARSQGAHDCARTRYAYAKGVRVGIMHFIPEARVSSS